MVINSLISFILHIDKHLSSIISIYGVAVYLLLFFIIFIETGLVIMPFLPGDSLLFAAGAFASIKALNIYLLLLLCSLAAILGDSANYWIGNRIGRRLFMIKGKWLLNEKHLESTERFYEKHGGKTIIIARFIPIIRTFAPFVAGAGSMCYTRFLAYNILGGILWVFLFVLGGYFFGNIPIVKNNFSVVILAIIFISVLPLIIKGITNYLGKRKN
jgi:membrane-associated protein